MERAVTLTHLYGNVYELREGYGVRRDLIMVKLLFGEASLAEKFRGEVDQIKQL
jgi:hypothetical protein